MKNRAVDITVLTHNHIINRNIQRTYHWDGSIHHTYPGKKHESITAKIVFKTKEDFFELEHLIILGEGECTLFFDGHLLKGYLQSMDEVVVVREYVYAEIFIVVSGEKASLFTN